MNLFEEMQLDALNKSFYDLEQRFHDYADKNLKIIELLVKENMQLKAEVDKLSKAIFSFQDQDLRIRKLYDENVRLRMRIENYEQTDKEKDSQAETE